MPTVSLRTVDYENFILLLNVEIFNLKIVKKHPDTQKAPYLKTYLHNQPNPFGGTTSLAKLLNQRWPLQAKVNAVTPHA
jgi:hypothetical protein